MTEKQRIYLDILHLYLSETVAKFALPARRTLYGIGRKEKISRAINSILKSIKNSFYYFSRKTIYQKKLVNAHWIYVIGNNNLNSLTFIKNDLSNTVFVTPFNFSKIGVPIIQLFLPLHFFFFLKNIPTLIRLVIQKEYPVQRSWDAAVRTTGQYEAALYFLKKHLPRAISFSNDHTIESRAMLLAAKQLNIPTFYIQHACVRPDFPPLKFSVSFLEGQDALDKYQLSGPVEGAVKLVGVPRITPYLNQKKSVTAIKAIGLCANLLDLTEDIEILLKALTENFSDHKITYRPHPSDRRKISIPSDVNISNSREENPFKFLLKQDLVIAGNTSIHYEAALLNVHAIYYKFDAAGKTEDMYGFVKNGLVPEATNKIELIDQIKNISPNQELATDKIQYYDATINTPNEGHSHELVVKGIQEYLNQTQPTI